MTTQSIVQSLAGLFKKPLTKLPRAKRVIAEKYIKQWPKLSPTERRAKAEEIDARAKEFHRQQATKLRLKLGRARREREKVKKDPKWVAGEIVGWWNGEHSLNAASWWRIANIKPEEAARLLCQSNPHDPKGDPLNTTTTETKPVDYKNLLREFEDMEQADKQPRTLKQWRDIAKNKGLKYHSWIDEYERAMQSVQKDADDRRKAGRRTLWEVTMELTTKSGAAKGRWLGLIVEQVQAGTLSLKNPKDYADPLPCVIPQDLFDIYDSHVSADDVNTWLAAHPELGNFRLGDVVPASAVPENKEGEANPGQQDAGVSQDENGIYKCVNGEPYLKKGKNNRAAMAAWVQWQARDNVKDGDTVDSLGERIQLTSERYGYQSERQKDGELLSVQSIVRMLPAGITGGRAKSKSRPKK